MQTTMLRRLAGLFLVAALAVGLATTDARASEIVGRNVYAPTLAVDRSGTALVTFKVAGGGLRHVLYWGGADWTDELHRDYSGGWKSKKADWKRFTNACRPYTGPEIPLLVTACTMPDGSHWALQKWARLWANYGGHAAQMELHVSHWTGDIGVLDIQTDWGYHGMWRHLWGTFSYHGKAVFGTKHTITGVPLDKQGRNVYVDYHKDGVWQRENSFLTHDYKGLANFCYLFSRHAGRVGNGDAYRATAIGPGVSPIVRTTFAAPGTYDEAADAQANATQRQLFGGDSRCTIN
jgi:hypothetical protein